MRPGPDGVDRLDMRAPGPIRTAQSRRFGPPAARRLLCRVRLTPAGDDPGGGSGFLISDVHTNLQRWDMNVGTSTL